VSSAGLNPAINAARAAPPLPMLPPPFAGVDVEPHTCQPVSFVPRLEVVCGRVPELPPAVVRVKRQGRR
jgi:hypothetical protein